MIENSHITCVIVVLVLYIVLRSMVEPNKEEKKNWPKDWFWNWWNEKVDYNECMITLYHDLKYNQLATNQIVTYEAHKQTLDTDTDMSTHVSDTETRLI
jgi:hypothetical protein